MGVNIFSTSFSLRCSEEIGLRLSSDCTIVVNQYPYIHKSLLYSTLALFLSLNGLLYTSMVRMTTYYYDILGFHRNIVCMETRSILTRLVVIVHVKEIECVLKDKELFVYYTFH